MGFSPFSTFILLGFTLMAAEPCKSTYYVAEVAEGDGVRDDAEAIQKLIDESCEKSTIHFGPATKTYLLSHELILLPERTYLGSATLKLRNPPAESFRDRPVQGVLKAIYEESNGITIAGLTLDGNGVGGGIALNVDGGSTEYVERFEMRDCTIRNGMRGEPWIAAIYAINLRDSRILNNRIRSQPSGIVIYNVQHVRIEGNDFDTITRFDAINPVQTLPDGVDLLIRNNTGRRLARMAIEVFGGSAEGMIDGVVVEGNRFTDWLPGAKGDTFGISVVTGKRAIVARNTLASAVATGYGIEAGVPGLVVENNTVTGFPIGIEVQGQPEMVLRGNRLLGQTDTGIFFSNSGRSNNRRTQVINNVIENAQHVGIGSVPNDPGGSVFRGNTITRRAGFFPGDAKRQAPYVGIKVDAGQTLPLIFEKNTITQTAPAAGRLVFWGFGLFGHLAAGGNVFDGNTIESKSTQPMGTGFRIFSPGLLDRDTVRNTKWSNLSHAAEGEATGRITKANNLTCGVTHSDPLLVTGVNPACPAAR